MSRIIHSVPWREPIAQSYRSGSLAAGDPVGGALNVPSAWAGAAERAYADGISNLPFNNFSIGAWLNPDATFPAADGAIFGPWVFSPGPSFGYLLALTSARVPKLYYSFDGTSSGTVTGSKAIGPASAWNHLLLTYDGTNARFYINGIIDSVLSLSSTGALFSSVSDLQVGRDKDNSINFSGDIGPLRVWDRVLTGAEASEYWRLLSHELPTTSGLVMDYAMNDGRDAASGNDLTLVGTATFTKGGFTEPAAEDANTMRTIADWKTVIGSSITPFENWGICDQPSADPPPNGFGGDITFASVFGTVLYEQAFSVGGNGMELDAGATVWIAGATEAPVGTGDFTMLCILQILDTPTDASDRYLFGKRDAGSPYEGFACTVRNNGEFRGLFDPGVSSVGYSIVDRGAAGDLVGTFGLAIVRSSGNSRLYVRELGESSGESGADVADSTDYDNHGVWSLGDTGLGNNWTGQLYRSWGVALRAYSDSELDTITQSLA